MKNFSNKQIVGAAVLLALVLSQFTLQAQPGPPGPGEGGPIDGGAIALVIGAAVLGYRKMKANKNHEA